MAAGFASDVQLDCLATARARAAEGKPESSERRFDRIALGLKEYAKRPARRRSAPVSVPAGSVPMPEAER